jgi:hypothetical protein
VRLPKCKINPRRVNTNERLGEDIMTNVATTAGSAPWYRTLNRSQWKALVASNLGWTFERSFRFGPIGQA